MGFRQFVRAMGLDGLPRPDPVKARDFMLPAVDAALTELLPWLDTLLSTWELYLRVGGFPRAVSDHLAHGGVQDDFVRALWDVTAGEAVRGAGTTAAQVQAMLGRLTRSLTSPLAVESLRADIGVESPHTAKARLQDLVFAYLAWPCHQRDGNTPKLSAQSKYYFIDPLMARLASMRSQGAIAEADTSAISEQQLGIELLRGSAGHPRPAGHQRRRLGRPGAPHRLDAQRLKRGAPQPDRRSARAHSSQLPRTPAMAAGAADHVWSLQEIAVRRLVLEPP